MSINTTDPHFFKLDCLYKDSLTNGILASYFTLSVLCALLALSTICVNVLVLLSVLKLKRYKDASDILLIMLNINDLFAGIIVYPSGIWFTSFTSLYGVVSCKLEILITCVVFIFACNSSLLTLFMTREMCVRILKPFHVTDKRNTVIAALVIWLVLVSVTALSAYLVPGVLYELTGVIFTVVQLLIFSGLAYGRYALYKELKAMAEQRPAAQEESNTLKKFSNITTMIFIAHVSVTTPIGLLKILEFSTSRSLFAVHYVRPWFVLLAMSSPLVNPIIHSLQLKSVRDCAKEMIFRKNRQEAGVPQPCQ